MKETNKMIRINDVEEAKKLVSAAMKCPFDIDIVAKGKFFIDAKSILGVLSLGVEEPLTAYNAFEARRVFLTNKVDIILCDIEMPVESGISLFRWVKAQNYPVECIFLTAHADFPTHKRRFGWEALIIFSNLPAMRISRMRSCGRKTVFCLSRRRLATLCSGKLSQKIRRLYWKMLFGNV